MGTRVAEKGGGERVRGAQLASETTKRQPASREALETAARAIKP